MLLNFPVVLRTLGGLLLFLGGALLMPALVGWIYAEPEAWGFVWAAGLAVGLGGVRDPFLFLGANVSFLDLSSVFSGGGGDRD